MTEQQEINVDKLLNEEKSDRLKWGAFREIRPCKKNILLSILTVVISIIISTFIVLAENSRGMIKDIIEMFNEIEIAFLGIVFGAYALFQAMISNDFLDVMSRTKDNILLTSNKSFLNLIILYVYGIFTNVILLIVLAFKDNNSAYLEEIVVREEIIITLLSVYLTFCCLLLWEIINFAINLYRMFNYYNAYKIIRRNIDKRENE